MRVLTSNYKVDIPVSSVGTTKSNIYSYDFFDTQQGSVTVATTNIPLLNNRIFTLLQDYSILQDDWDGDDSLAPTENVTQDAFYLSLLMEKTGQRIFHTAPGPSGEIMLDLRNEETQRSVEIIFYPKKSIFVTFSESDVPRQGIFSFELLPELLEWLNLSANV